MCSKCNISGTSMPILINKTVLAQLNSKLMGLNMKLIQVSDSLSDTYKLV